MHLLRCLSDISMLYRSLSQSFSFSSFSEGRSAEALMLSCSYVESRYQAMSCSFDTSRYQAIRSIVQLTKRSVVNVSRGTAIVGLPNDSAYTIEKLWRRFSFSAVQLLSLDQDASLITNMSFLTKFCPRLLMAFPLIRTEGAYPDYSITRSLSFWLTLVITQPMIRLTPSCITRYNVIITYYNRNPLAKNSAMAIPKPDKKSKVIMTMCQSMYVSLAQSSG